MSRVSRKSGDYKKANKPFHDQIMARSRNTGANSPPKRRNGLQIHKGLCERGHGRIDLEAISSRRDHNSTPERKVPFTERVHPEKALMPAGEGKDDKDYSD